jgi:hypothetical protein
MAGIVIVTAAVIFVLGFALGVIFLVSLGIRKEERRFLRTGEVSITRPATDQTCQAARGFVHLWVRKQEGAGQWVPQQPRDERPYPYGQSALGSGQDRTVPGPQDI